MSPGLDSSPLSTLAARRAHVRRALLRDADEDRDLLLIQVADPPPDERRMRFRLKILGLSGRGSTNVLASSNPGVRRLLAGSRRFVHAVPLAMSAAREPVDAYVMSREEEAVRPESYPVEGHEALQFDVGDDERLYVEPYGGHFSLAWTTALSSPALLRRLEELLPANQDGTWTVTTGNSDETLTGPVQEILDRLASNDEPLEFWRLDLPDRAFTWERREVLADVVGHGLMGFIGVDFSEGDLSRLIEATATPAVGARVLELVHQGAQAVRTARALQRTVE